MGAVWFDGASYTVWFDGVPLELNRSEYTVFVCLCTCRGALVTRRYLQQVLCTDLRRPIQLRTVDVHVSRLRRKYKKRWGNNIVDCVWHEGYVLRAA